MADDDRMTSGDKQISNGRKGTILIVAISLMIGFGGGWFSFRSKEISDLRKLKTLTVEAGYNDDSMKEAILNFTKLNSDLDELLSDMDAGNQRNAVISLAAFEQIEAGKIENVKKFLAGQVASYYCIYGPPDSSGNNTSEEKVKMLNRIQEAMEKSPFLETVVKKY